MTDSLIIRIAKVAMELLKEHYESNDPYVDDYPTARHEAARHRAACTYCKSYARWLKTGVPSEP